MRRIMPVAVALALALLVLTGCAGTCNRNLESCRTQVAQLQAHITELEAQKRKAEAEANQMRDQLRGFSEKEQLKLEEVNLCTILRIPNQLLFPSGSAELTKKGKELISQVAEILKPHADYEVQVRGHTDSVQIKPEFRAKYADNWALSAARAATVVRFLVSEYKMDPAKLLAIGQGEYQPIVSNDTPEGREQNRRVEFYILPGERIKPLSEEQK